MRKLSPLFAIIMGLMLAPNASATQRVAVAEMITNTS
jgi:hypothetical protein